MEGRGGSERKTSQASIHAVVAQEYLDLGVVVIHCDYVLHILYHESLAGRSKGLLRI